MGVKLSEDFHNDENILNMPNDDPAPELIGFACGCLLGMGITALFTAMCETIHNPAEVVHHHFAARNSTTFASVPTENRLLTGSQPEV